MILLLHKNISKIQITKISLLEKRELNEEFFKQLYPNDEVKTEADFRNKVKEEIQAYWDNQAKVNCSIWLIMNCWMEQH
jgi:FKBP-type peptidyl-prolyl cis-trans isomerase (trigger factor)